MSEYTHEPEWRVVCAVAGTVFLSLMFVGTGTTFPVPPVADPDGPQAPVRTDCAVCHDDVERAFSLTPHGSLEPRDLAAGSSDTACVACHGDADEHVSTDGDGEIFSFSEEDSPLVKTQQCMTCHVQSHPRFMASAHAVAGQDCVTCHSVHDEPEPLGTSPWTLLGRESAACATCHSDVLTEFTFNERHRLEEGALECSSCHDPHEPTVRVRLGGFKSQECITCHTDKGGPFVFEHGASIVEGCVACHTPHGSPNRHMLTFQRVAEQCFSCHSVVPGFHSRFGLDNQCTECHSTIHGSNFDPHFLK